MSPRATYPSVRARPRSLTLPTIAALGLVLAVVAGMFAMLLLTTRSLDATAKSGRRATEVQQEVLQLERTAIDLETGVRGFMITRDSSYLEPYERGRHALSAHVHTLLDLADAREREQVLDIRDALSSYVNDYTEPLVRATKLRDA